MKSTRPALFPTRPWLTPVLVAAMLVAMALQIAIAVHGESVTWDEGDHLFAGFMSLRTHDYGLNPEHPPMPKMVGALPLVGLPLKVPLLQNRYFKTEAYLDGRDLLFGNAPPASLTAPLQYTVPAAQGYAGPDLMFRARLAMMIFPLTMALLVFLTAREMFGEAAGLLGMFLAVTEPNLLAHGPFVTTDSAASCCFLGAIFALYRFCKVPSFPRLLVVGVAGGVALAAKHSTVFLLPMFVILLGVEVYLRARARRSGIPAADMRATPPLNPPRPLQKSTVLHDVLTLYGALAVIIVLAVFVLWCFYGWRYNARPAGLALNPSLAVACSQIRPVEGKILMGIAHLHLLPESYLYGLADIRNVANTWPSYMFGKVFAHGVWYYFPLSLLIKSTLPELLLLVLALAAVATGTLRRPREVLFLLIPIAVYLAAGMESGLNIGMRHILPLYPLAAVLAAGGAVALAATRRLWRNTIAFLLGFQAFTSLHAFPNYVAYSNEAFGGPANTYKYLTDSSTDWAQQLIAVKAYVVKNNIHDCWFAYWTDPLIQAADYGIPCRVLPTWDNMSADYVNPVPTDIAGPIFINHGPLTGYEYRSVALNPLRQFIPLHPVAQIQEGVFVYNGTFHVPELSSASHLALSRIALKKNDTATAITEGQASVALWPTGIEPLEQLGDSLHAANRNPEARQAYQSALDHVRSDMEPGARAVYEPELQGKLTAAP